MPYVLKHQSGQYFAFQNLFLGQAQMSDLQGAKILSKKEALSTFNCMNEPYDWQIVRVKKGWVEDGVEKTHYDILKEQKEQLEKQLQEVNSKLGNGRRKVEPVDPEDESVLFSEDEMVDLVEID